MCLGTPTTSEYIVTQVALTAHHEKLPDLALFLQYVALHSNQNAMRGAVESITVPCKPQCTAAAQESPDCIFLSGSASALCTSPNLMDAELLSEAVTTCMEKDLNHPGGEASTKSEAVEDKPIVRARSALQTPSVPPNAHNLCIFTAVGVDQLGVVLNSEQQAC